MKLRDEAKQEVQQAVLIWGVPKLSIKLPQEAYHIIGGAFG